MERKAVSQGRHDQGFFYIYLICGESNTMPFVALQFRKCTPANNVVLFFSSAISTALETNIAILSPCENCTTLYYTTKHCCILIPSTRLPLPVVFILLLYVCVCTEYKYVDLLPTVNQSRVLNDI